MVGFLYFMPQAEVEAHINNLSSEDIKRYTDYWKTITPTTHRQVWDRWAFAFLSVHTSWQANLRAYKNLIKADYDKLSERDYLRQIIVNSRVGLDKMRTEGIGRFKETFWKDPAFWYKKDNESWSDYRERTMELCYGLGYAKTSFAIELCYPTTCELTCLDTHMLQLYGVKSSPSPSPSKYKELEKHWINKCKEKEYPSFQVRNVYWDKVQDQKDTRYWSSVFEENICT
jgi:hypothetical protein